MVVSKEPLIGLNPFRHILFPKTVFSVEQVKANKMKKWKWIRMRTTKMNTNSKHVTRCLCGCNRTWSLNSFSVDSALFIAKWPQSHKWQLTSSRSAQIVVTICHFAIRLAIQCDSKHYFKVQKTQSSQFCWLRVFFSEKNRKNNWSIACITSLLSHFAISIDFWSNLWMSWLEGLQLQKKITSWEKCMRTASRTTSSEWPHA